MQFLQLNMIDWELDGKERATENGGNWVYAKKGKSTLNEFYGICGWEMQSTEQDPRFQCQMPFY